MKLTRIITLTLISPMLLASTDILHTPGLKLGLGGNLNLNFPFQKKERCLQAQDGVWTQVNTGALYLNYDSSLVKSHRDLDSRLNIDVTLEAKAKFKVFSFDKKFESSIKHKYKSTKDSLSYLVNAHYDFGQKEIEEVVLKPRYQKLLDEGNYQEFIRRCGTHYVQSTHQKAMANLLITSDSLNKTEMNHVIASLNSGGSIGEVSGSYTAKADFFYQMVTKVSNTKVYVEANGGNSSAFNGFDDYESAKTSFNGFLKTITRESSVPSRYTVLPIPGLPPSEIFEIDEEFLSRAYYIAIEIDDELSRVKELLADYDHTQTKWMKDLREAQRVLTYRQKVLNQMVKDCEKKGICRKEDLSFRSLNFAATSDFLEKIEMYRDDDSEVVKVVIEGKLVDSALVKSLSVIRVVDGLEQVELESSLKDWSFDSRNFRFIGIADRYVKSELEGKSVSYMVKVRDVNDREEEYPIQFY